MVTVGRKGYSFLSNGLILRRWAYPQSCALRMTAPSAEARRWTEPVWQLSDHPRYPFGAITLQRGRNPTLAGRGGSVSRRDHNQAAGNRAHSQAEPSPKKRPPPNASRSSGEGVWGRGASLREAASPPEFPPKRHVFREGSAREGTFLQKRPLPRKHTQS